MKISRCVDRRVTHIIFNAQAACWTDGRYYLQASEQLDCNWHLIRGSVPSISQWLASDAAGLANSSTVVVAADPRLYGASAWIRLEGKLADAFGLGLEFTDLGENLIDVVWADRPQRERRSIVTHPLQFAGRKWEEKVMQSIMVEVFHGEREREGEGGHLTAQNQ